MVRLEWKRKRRVIGMITLELSKTRETTRSDQTGMEMEVDG